MVIWILLFAYESLTNVLIGNAKEIGFIQAEITRRVTRISCKLVILKQMIKPLKEFSNSSRPPMDMVLYIAMVIEKNETTRKVRN